SGLKAECEPGAAPKANHRDGASSDCERDVTKCRTSGNRKRSGRPATPFGSSRSWDEDRPASLQKGSVAACLGSSRASTATSFLPAPSRSGKNHQMYGRTQIILKVTA